MRLFIHEYTYCRICDMSVDIYTEVLFVVVIRPAEPNRVDVRECGIISDVDFRFQLSTCRLPSTLPLGVYFNLTDDQAGILI